MDRPTLRVQRSGDAPLPSYATAGAAGLDLCASMDVVLEPFERALVPTGLRLEIPEGYEGQVRARSGLALKHGLAMVNAPGTVDSDYRGEIGVILINMGKGVVELRKGDRIAQLVICPVARANVVEGEISTTDRGEGGFGSTGR